MTLPYQMREDELRIGIKCRPIARSRRASCRVARILVHVIGERFACLTAQLRQKISRPFKFQWSSGGAPVTIYGYDATILIDLCHAIVKAEADKKLDPATEESRCSGTCNLGRIGQGRKSGGSFTRWLATTLPPRKSSQRSNCMCKRKRKSTNESFRTSCMRSGTDSMTFQC